jgi:hypothetical protein
MKIKDSFLVKTESFGEGIDLANSTSQFGDIQRFRRLLELGQLLGVGNTSVSLKIM